MLLLPTKSYHVVNDLLNEVNLNHFFAKSVVGQKVSGKIFADDLSHPRTFYIVHPYGMSLLLGDCSNPVFNEALRDYALNIHKSRKNHEWMQVFPLNWHPVLEKLLGHQLIKTADNKEEKTAGIVELSTRVNFKFDRELFEHSRKTNVFPGITIMRTDSRLFREMTGTVIPSAFWNSEEDFLQNGIGYSVLCENKLAATAYSSFIHAPFLELGIETVPEFRGRGLAKLACVAIIDYCLSRRLEPVWACRLENAGSYKLAQKVGFRPCMELPYYRLSN